MHEDEVLRQAQASLQPCSSLLEGGAVLDPWPWTRLGARVSSNQAYREVERIVPSTVRGCIDMHFEDMGCVSEILGFRNRKFGGLPWGSPGSPACTMRSLNGSRRSTK